MLDLGGIPLKELVALKFSETVFREAARVAVEQGIPVEAPGHNTLIVRRSDRGMFSGLGFEEKAIQNGHLGGD